MSRNMVVSLTIQVRDQATAAINQAIHSANRLIQIQQHQASSTTTATAASQHHTTAVIQQTQAEHQATAAITQQTTAMNAATAATTAAATAAQHSAAAINNQTTAYRRLSQAEQESLARQQRMEQVLQRNNRQRELQAMQARRAAEQEERLNRLAKGGTAVVGAGVAAGIVMRSPLSTTVNYNDQLARLANTAFDERSTTGRIAGKRELDAAINQALTEGGGNRDSAASALGELIASGVYSPTVAMKMLPTLQKASVATGAASEDLAQIGIKSGMMGFKPEDFGHVLDMANKGGKLGGFELKDMAKWLPQQMAAATLSGMTGESGMAKLIAFNEVAVKTAGTKDEAGNNVVNLLQKINSSDTARDAKNLGINLAGTLAAGRKKGIDSLDAFLGIVDHVVGKNKEFTTLSKQAKGAKDEDKKRIYQQMAAILEGSAIGKIIQDRQALLALIGAREYKDEMHSIQHKTQTESKESIQSDHDVVKQEAKYQFEQAGNQFVTLQMRILDPIAGLAGNIAGIFAGLSQRLPTLTTGIVGLIDVIGLMTAAGAAFSLVLGKEKVLSVASNIFSLGTAATAAARMLQIGIAWEIGQAIGGLINDSMNKGEGTWHDEIGKLVAAIMSVGSKDAQDALNTRAEYEGRKEAEKNKQPINVHSHIYLDGNHLTSHVETRMTRQSSRK